MADESATESQAEGEAAPALKSLRDVRARYDAACAELDDVGVAAFLLQNAFGAEPTAAASIGAPAEAEFLGLNSAVHPGAAFVVLGIGRRAGDHERIAELTGLAEREGFELRAQSADLVLPGRWAQLLPALSPQPIGVLGVDAAWAASEPKFWDSLKSYLRAGSALVYIRGALDFRHAGEAVTLLRGLPSEADVQVVAATRRSLWLAASPGAPRLRALLRSSGLFGSAAAGPADEGPLVVDQGWGADSLDAAGRFARFFARLSGEPAEGVDIGKGWWSPEADGRWTQAPEAGVRIRHAAQALPEARLVVTGNAWIPPGDEAQVVELGLGARPRRWTALSYAPGEIKAAGLELSAADLADGALELKVKVRKPGKPSDHGEPDSRTLGFKLRSIGLFA